MDFDFAIYKGLLVQKKVSKALVYLEKTQQNECYKSLYNELYGEVHCSFWDAFVNEIMTIYYRYFQNCFVPDRNTTLSSNEAKLKEELHTLLNTNLTTDELIVF